MVTLPNESIGHTLSTGGSSMHGERGKRKVDALHAF